MRGLSLLNNAGPELRPLGSHRVTNHCVPCRDTVVVYCPASLAPRGCTSRPQAYPLAVTVQGAEGQFHVSQAPKPTRPLSRTLRLRAAPVVDVAPLSLSLSLSGG